MSGGQGVGEGTLTSGLRGNYIALPRSHVNRYYTFLNLTIVLSERQYRGFIILIVLASSIDIPLRAVEQKKEGVGWHTPFIIINGVLVIK